MSSRVESDARSLVEDCRIESLHLLERNLTPQGILAARRASPPRRAATRASSAAMPPSACSRCAAAASRRSSSARWRASMRWRSSRRPTGRSRSTSTRRASDADFWYLGCIDADAVVADRAWTTFGAHGAVHGPAGGAGSREVRRALDWLLAQEHQHFGLLQQNEASDWADIMPRSGFVLYTNALWYRVKRLLRAARRRGHARITSTTCSIPFRARPARVPRARGCCSHYARRGRRNPGLYLSFVNLSFAGDEGDVFGNVLAILAASPATSMAHDIVQDAAGRARRRPVSGARVTRPDVDARPLWRAYMARHRQNHPPPVPQRRHLAVHRRLLGDDAGPPGPAARRPASSWSAWRVQRSGGLALHGMVPRATLQPMGMPGQSWNAAAFLCAQRMLLTGQSP